MEIKNLKEGQVIKNYKELCKVLEIEPKKSNDKMARKIHHEEFSSHFEY